MRKLEPELRDVKWDIKKGYGVYRSVYTPQLAAWIKSGHIRKGEAVVWRSGFSGFRPPELLPELANFFRTSSLSSRRVIAHLSRRPTSRPRKRDIHKILIVDDEERICWLLQTMLKKRGYEVDTAGSAKDALAKVRRLRPDLILLDLRLPDRSGMVLLKQLRRARRQLLICVISAYGTEEVRRQAKANGILRFIDKPFTIQKIQRVIHSATRPTR